ncbi:MAG: hypothetical protein ACTSVW_00460 [Candidatus Njordarchaeales archaeon]
MNTKPLTKEKRKTPSRKCLLLILEPDKNDYLVRVEDGKQRVEWLLKEIEKKCKEWEAIDYYRQPTFGEIETELKTLIKKAFSGVVEE